MIQGTKPTKPASAAARDDARLQAADDVYHSRRVLGHAIRLLRARHMISLSDLAVSLNVSEVHLQAIEAGETIVTPQTRAKLELVLGEKL